MTSLVRHLRAFARDVRLSQAEWETAIGFLTRTGHITDGRRQEFILLSDVLGLSMLTVGINAPPTSTWATTRCSASRTASSASSPSTKASPPPTEPNRTAAGPTSKMTWFWPGSEPERVLQ